MLLSRRATLVATSGPSSPHTVTHAGSPDCAILSFTAARLVARRNLPLGRLICAARSIAA